MKKSLREQFGGESTQCSVRHSFFLALHIKISSLKQSKISSEAPELAG